MYLDLELSITEKCNLRCPYCSVGIFLSPPDRELSLERLKEISLLFKGTTFRAVRITGGEPMLHPEFENISASLRELFNTKYTMLLTNGLLINKFLPSLKYYSRVLVSHHVGINDKIMNDLPSGLNIFIRRREEGNSVTDITCSPNKGNGLAASRECMATHIIKVSGDRLFPCCLLNGLCTLRGISREKLSVPLTKNWKQDLENLNLPSLCEQCFYDQRIID